MADKIYVENPNAWKAPADTPEIEQPVVAPVVPNGADTVYQETEGAWKAPANAPVVPVQPTNGSGTTDGKPSGTVAGGQQSTVAGGQAAAGVQDGNVLTESQMIERFGVNPTTGTAEVSTPVTGQADKVTTPSVHQFKWGEPDVSLETVMAGEGKNVPKRQILDDYLRWSQETGQPIDYFTVNDIMNNSQDLKNTPEDDEKARKKAERKERFDRMGNFLLHLGNAIGNVAGGGYGAVKLEDPVQWTERQRLIKEKTDEQRRRNNQSIWVQMQKDRADQRAYELKKQQEATNAAYRQALIDATKQKTEDNSRVAGAKVAWYNAKTGAIEMKTPEEINKIIADTEKSRQQGNAAIIRANKSGGKGGGKSNGQNTTVTVKENEYNSDGKVIKSKSVTTKGKSTSSQQSNKGKISTGVKWVKK